MKDMTIQPRAVRLLEYLEAVRGLREQPVRDIAEYQDRRWWAGDIPAHPSCVLTATGDEPWLMVSKAQIPSAPAVPEDVVPHLRVNIHPLIRTGWLRVPPVTSGRDACLRRVGSQL